MKPTPLTDISAELVEFNRERVKNELAQGIFELMQWHGITRTELARLLDVGKSRVSQMLSGEQNFEAETLADVFLVLGRTPHLTLGTDIQKIRFPVDEGAAFKAGTAETTMVSPVGTYSYVQWAPLLNTTSSTIAPGNDKPSPLVFGGGA